MAISAKLKTGKNPKKGLMWSITHPNMVRSNILDKAPPSMNNMPHKKSTLFFSIALNKKKKTIMRLIISKKTIFSVFKPNDMPLLQT